MQNLMGDPIRFSQLEVSYGGAPVLSGFHGAVRSGTLTALIGPNGSGKSTLLRTFAGLLPYKGSLTLGFGSEVREVSRTTRRELGRLVGVVPQQVRMAAPFTVYDAVALGRLPCRGAALLERAALPERTGSEEDRLILDAIARADLEHLLFRDVTRLSAGEAQRVLLATVLAQDPPVLLLDEPSSALDPHQTARVFSLLRQLADSGKTVVAAVHDVNLAVAYADVLLALTRPEPNGNALSDVPPERPIGNMIEKSIKELDEEVLERIYGVPFEPYVSRKGKKAWHVRES
ncbi:MAG: ABC transporter ATP-binding protein [Synergistaceae bacterium]|jgi:iron complex transport system ATP-binding protein|nr:ABC transporter ATP-binding protein [Synergistaceae bacterium]